MYHALILAGGRGTRFWPVSRKDNPKQFLKLFGDKTMLRMTYERISEMVPPENAWVSTHRDYVDRIAGELPEIPKGNILGEPAPRNTAPCLAWASLVISALDPEAVILVVTADHYIPDKAAFQRVAAAAFEAAQKFKALLTFGVSPAHPETGYGYIKAEQVMAEIDGLPIRKVAEFKEKPDAATARRYLAEGDYYWNSGMFVWQAGVFLDNFRRFLPAHGEILDDIERAWLPNRDDAILEKHFKRFKPVSVDYGVLEPTDDVLLAPAEFPWCDIGSWAALPEALPQDENGNVRVGETLTVDSRNSVLFSTGRMIAALGVEDIVVVETPDAVLVCPKEKAQDIRRIVDELKNFT